MKASASQSAMPLPQMVSLSQRGRRRRGAAGGRVALALPVFALVVLALVGRRCTDAWPGLALPLAAAREPGALPLSANLPCLASLAAIAHPRNLSLPDPFG
ncbi:MAG: hypothetical protein AAFY02_14665 [Pseudomonadota bacterium]